MLFWTVIKPVNRISSSQRWDVAGEELEWGT